MDEPMDQGSGSVPPPERTEPTGAPDIPAGEPGPEGASGPGAAGKAGGIDVQAMLGQLQSMITQVAAASAPALREVAAKAAELAAVAGDRAGPVAHTLADKTEQAGHALADRAASFAEHIRSQAAAGHAGTDDAGSGVPPGTAAEDSPRDGA
jgi:hypothetical protein